MSRLLNFIEKKGTALTIPYSGKPERPRRSNYPFNGGFVSQKTLVIKCANAVFVFLLTYIIHIFFKKSTGKITKYSHIFPVKYVGSYHINIISTSNTSHLISCGHSPSINKSHHEKLDIPALDFS